MSLCSIMALIYAHKSCETIGECSQGPTWQRGTAPHGVQKGGCAR